MDAALYGHLSVLLLLLQYSVNPDLQSNKGSTAVMLAAGKGHEACVKALLRANANTELLDEDGDTALRWAEDKGHTAIAKLFRPAPPQPAVAVPPQATQTEQAAQAARADAAMAALLAEEAAEQAKAQAPSKKSKKKKKARDAAAAGDEPSEAPPPAATAPPPTAAPKPAASAAARAEAALRAAIAGGGLSTLEAALAAAPREVREGGVGVEARARRDRLLEAQQEAEREAKQEAAAAAARLGEAMAQKAARVAAASEAREEAIALAALAVATAKADALERATAGDGDGGGSGTAGPSEASEAAVPDQLVCPITAEIMTDPVNTVRLALSLIASHATATTQQSSLWPGPRASHHTLPVSRTRAGGRPYVRAQRHRAVARDPQHLAHDRPRAGQQAAHPEPLPSQPHPRVTRARPLKAEALTKP